MASHTESASMKGGSPTALLRPITDGLGNPSSSETRKSPGISCAVGILYVSGECVRRRPSASHTISSVVTQPTPLHEASLNLTHVDSWIDRIPGVVKDVGPQKIN